RSSSSRSRSRRTDRRPPRVLGRKSNCDLDRGPSIVRETTRPARPIQGAHFMSSTFRVLVSSFVVALAAVTLAAAPAFAQGGGSSGGGTTPPPTPPARYCP